MRCSRLRDPGRRPGERCGGVRGGRGIAAAREAGEEPARRWRWNSSRSARHAHVSPIPTTGPSRPMRSACRGPGRPRPGSFRPRSTGSRPCGKDLMPVAMPVGAARRVRRVVRLARAAPRHADELRIRRVLSSRHVEFTAAHHLLGRTAEAAWRDPRLNPDKLQHLQRPGKHATRNILVHSRRRFSARPGWPWPSCRLARARPLSRAERGPAPWLPSRWPCGR